MANKNTMNGRRIYPDPEGRLRFTEGDYGFDPHPLFSRWVVRPPGCNAGGIPNHEVIEHEDGTITVSPSILLYDDDGDGGYKVAWHGYLERGVWREV